MQTNNLFEKKVSNMNNIITFITWYKVCHLRKTIYHNKDAIPPLLVLGNPKIKSIEISAQGIEETGRGMYKPYGFKRDLDFLYVVQ
jgi:hypothetical protein